jgi:hypothetical protein
MVLRPTVFGLPARGEKKKERVAGWLTDWLAVCVL